MDAIDINALKPNIKNPRSISKHDYAALIQSLKRFGDLSGIVFNTRTNELVGGHQRIQAFKQLGGQPVITERYDQPNSVGTIAIGYVLLGDEKFAYREVDWDAGIEYSANIAANRISGEWDLDKLAAMNFDISQFDNGAELLELTGQTEQELERLNAGPDVDQEKPDDGLARLSLKFTQEQSEVVFAAVDRVKSQVRLNNEGNGDNDANAIYYICRDFMDRGLDDQIQDQVVEAAQEPAA